MLNLKFITFNSSTNHNRDVISNSKMRYLSTSEIQIRLNLGKTVEQWLTPVFEEVEEMDVLTWLVLEKAGSSIELQINKVFDCMEYETIEFSDLKSALDHIQNNLGVIPNKFLNAGMCQEEYKNYINSKS